MKYVPAKSGFDNMVLTWQHKQLVKQNISVSITQPSKIVVTAHFISYKVRLTNLFSAKKRVSLT